jgi:hypothetical protein
MVTLRKEAIAAKHAKTKETIREKFPRILLPSTRMPLT